MELKYHTKYENYVRKYICHECTSITKEEVLGLWTGKARKCEVCKNIVEVGSMIQVTNKL